MLNDSIIERLEKVVPPSVTLQGHRAELRTALLREYTRWEEKAGISGFFRLPKPAWRSVAVTSALWLVILSGIILGYVVPGFQPDSVAARVIDTVMESPEIQSLLAGDEARTVSVVDAGGDEMEVLVESHGGRIIIARVDVADEKVRISAISYVIMIGSPYLPDVEVTGEELDRVIDVGKTSPSFRKLLEDGATVESARAIECLVTTRNLDAGTTDEARETWVMVTLTLPDSSCYFFIEPENMRVVDRGCREKTE